MVDSIYCAENSERTNRMTQEESIVPQLSYGPYVSTACFAEKVLEERDGVHSLIRVIDRVHITVKTQGKIKEPPKIRQPLILYISLKCGGERGSHELEIIPIKPNGEKLPRASNPIHFEGPEYKGVNVIVNMIVEIDGEGTWWFEIRHRNQLLTKVPLNVIFHVQPRQIVDPT